MNGLDVACTWIGRVWAVGFLLLVAAVGCAAVADARRRRADVRQARATGKALWLETGDAHAWTAAQIERRDLALWELEAGETA